MKPSLTTIPIISFILLFHNCSTTQHEDWSFLAVINAEMIIEKDCPVKIFSGDLTPPQECYAGIGEFEFYELTNKKVLSVQELLTLKKKLKEAGQKMIPAEVLRNYSKCLDQEEYIKLRKLGEGHNVFDQYQVSEYKTISNPIWINTGLVLIFVNSYGENEYASGGELMVFRKQNSTWTIAYSTNTWVS